MLNLRIGRFSLLGLLLTGLSIPAAAQAPQPPPLMMKQLKPNVWAAIGGAGGNSTIIIGETSVIVVDAKQTAASAKEMLDQIAKITPKPVSTVILTHSDGDHVNGLAAFPANIKIMAHDDCRREIEAAIKAGGPNAPPADRVPNEIVRYYAIGQGAGLEEERDTTIDGVKMTLGHWSRGHTSGDLVVYLPVEKIVATGDLIVMNRADDNPLIHPEKNGSTEGWLWNVKGIARLDAEIVVPGHGDLATMADVKRKLAATEKRRETIAAMVAQHKTLDEIKAALPDAPAPGAAAGAGRGGNPNQKTYVEIAYDELTNGSRPSALFSSGTGK